jgi:methylated-DNA-[protein]-cysteine S-methyltransferase
MPALVIETPVGRFTLVETDGVLTRCGWRGGAGADRTPLLDEAARQIAAYLGRELREFDLPLAAAATAEAQAARDAMCAVPFGATATYGDLARRTGSSARAFGQACGANVFPLIVPCHRVLPASGFGHYSGGAGTETKLWLLRHEGAALL